MDLLAVNVYPKYLDDGRAYCRGDGPTPSRVLLLGESPGRDEDASGRCFVGKTGQTCDVLWARVGLERGVNVRVENVLCYKPELYDKDGSIQQYELDRDRPRLIEKFARCQPQFVLAMGVYAAEAVLGEYLRGLGYEPKMDWMSGLVFRVPRPDAPQDEMFVVASYHPASGFHDQVMASRFWRALVAFGGYVKGEPAIPWHPDTAPTDYAKVETMPRVFAGKLGADTEWLSDGRPYCATVSWKHHQAVLAEAGSPALAQLGEGVARQGIRLVMHNGAADIGPLEDMGVRVVDFEDTMIAARVIGEPGGLKALATRWLGVRMFDYDDVLKPYRDAKWWGWLRRVRREALRRPSWSIRQGTGWSLRTYINSIYNKAVSARVLDGEVDVAAAWATDNMPEKYRAKVRAAVEPEPTVDLLDVPEDERIDYACRDADTALRLEPLLLAEVKASDAMAAYVTDRGMVPVLGRIRRVGMYVDRDALRALEIDMEAEERRLSESIVSIAGRKINPGSPLDIGRVLFDDFAQPARKLTSGGQQSTDSKTLEALRNRLLGRKAEAAEGWDEEANEAQALAFLDALVDYRHVTKLKSTNVTGMWGFLDSAGRLHPDLRMEAASGRCVSGGRDERGIETPNALAIPKRSRWGQRIRECFVAGEGMAYIVVDLDQIELRVAADVSRDERMKEIFDAGRDIHAETAVYLFKTMSGRYPDLDLAHVRDVIPGSQGVSFRDAGKTAGFGTLFGLTEYGGQEQMAKQGLLAPREEVRAWLDGWLDFFPRVRECRDATIALTRDRGYTVSRTGRRRYLPFIHSPFERDRNEAERQCFNHVIQTTAIEYMKQGVGGHVWPWMKGERAKGRDIEIVLTVHDDVEVVAEADRAVEVGAKVVELLCGAIKMRVPTRAKAAIGDSWGTAK